jgi:hypothetical protein
MFNTKVSKMPNTDITKGLIIIICLANIIDKILLKVLLMSFTQNAFKLAVPAL